MTQSDTHERVVQIQRWVERRTSANSDPYADLSRAFSEIRFLLSLIAGEVAGDETHRNFECVTTIEDETLWGPTCAARAEYLRGRSDAATAMRDACVAELKSLDRRDGPKKTDYIREGQDAAYREGIDDSIAAIESLTLDQVKR